MSIQILKNLHQRPIAYYPVYRKLTGSTTAGILLSFLVQNFVLEGKELFSKTDLVNLTKLSQSELELALNKISNFVIIESLSDGEVFDFLNKENSINGCLFCGYDKSYLDNHHYPTRKKDGGISTISLCANCHREFHYLSDFKKIYTPKKEIITEEFVSFVKEMDNE